MRRSKEEALETRRAILRVALDCFSTRGYALTTFNDIAARIHLTKGAVFWHFKSKEDLLAELIVQEHGIYEPLKGIGEVTSLEALKAAFAQWAQAIGEHRELRQFMLFAMSRVEWSEALKGRLRKRLEGLLVANPFDRLEGALGRLRAAGAVVSPLSDRQIAALLFSVFFGVHREAWFHKCDLDIAQTLDAGLDFIIQGIRSK